MSQVTPTTTLREFQEFVEKVYGVPNDRAFGQKDMITNVQRFTMRALKGIRKGDTELATLNLLIALTWLLSLMNRLHIDLENEVLKRFPDACSYCGESPCRCGERKPARRSISGKTAVSRNLAELQTMFEAIYPASGRTVEKAGIHLAEEMGELAEAILVYGGKQRSPEAFAQIELEAADLFSCMMGVFNSLGVNCALKLTELFSNNCHLCHKEPCQCDFQTIVSFTFNHA